MSEFRQGISKDVYEQNYKYKVEAERWPDSARRVVDTLLEQDKDKPWYESVRRTAVDALTKRRSLPAGRVIANTGTYKGATSINCFVSGYAGMDFEDVDSIPKIMEEITRCAKILSSEGGYGFCADWMRPRGALIRGTGARTPGAVEMLNLWDQTSDTLTKGPQTEAERTEAKNKIRKGAMMVTMSVWHPDVEEFITAKQESGQLSKFNMSILASDRFMEAVQRGDTWALRYPDYEAAPDKYEREWDGCLRDWKGPVKTYKELPARDLWNTIMESTYQRNEPGILFIDTIQNDNNLSYAEKIKATNPCGEQNLPPNGVCNLTNLVLPRYLQNNGSIDWAQMSDDIEALVIMADNVNDVTYTPLEAQEKELQQKRRIGLGHMGFGSLCAMMGVRYGSEESVELMTRIQRFVTNEAYMTSALLAKEKEPFPLFDLEEYEKGDMFKRLDPKVQVAIREFGLRNSHLTSIQPTGNTSVLAGNVSSGIEPIFMASYTRTAEQPHLPDGIEKPDFIDFENGEAMHDGNWAWETQGDENILRSTKDGFEDWQIHPTRGIVKDEPVRDYAVEVGGVDPEGIATTRTLDVQDHVRILEAAAEYVDSAISKTTNVPADYPFEDFKDLYKQMWETGVIKGGTTYRAGTMSAVLKENDDEENESGETELDEKSCPECRSTEIVMEDGCETCKNCGWSKCSV